MIVTPSSIPHRIRRNSLSTILQNIARHFWAGAANEVPYLGFCMRYRTLKVWQRYDLLRDFSKTI